MLLLVIASNQYNIIHLYWNFILDSHKLTYIKISNVNSQTETVRIESLSQSSIPSWRKYYIVHLCVPTLVLKN